MSHQITLKVGAKAEFKQKLRQFKQLIDFNEETHVIYIYVQGSIINNKNGVYYLSGEHIQFKGREIVIPTLGGLSIDKLKRAVYVTFSSCEK